MGNADSTHRRNDLRQFSRGGLETKRHAWQRIQAQGDRIELRLTLRREVHAFREVLAQQAAFALRAIAS